MAIATHPGPTTWDDVQTMPPDGKRYESFGGVLTVTPAPSRRHQLAVGAIYRTLHEAATADVSVLTAPYDWWISPTEWYEPDVIVFPRAAPSDLRLEVPPLLAVEVASPSTRLHDLNAKRAAYAANGCPAYWVVDPDEPSLLALHLTDGTYREAAWVVGEDTYQADLPFPVTMVPARLAE